MPTNTMKHRLEKIGAKSAFAGFAAGIALNTFLSRTAVWLLRNMKNEDSRTQKLIMGSFVTGVVSMGCGLLVAKFVHPETPSTRAKPHRDVRGRGHSFDIDVGALGKKLESSNDGDVTPRRRLRRGESSSDFTAIHEEVIEEMTIKRTSVTVRVPATSANMGPGYDCIGMALDMWSELTVERSNVFSIESSGDGAENVPSDETNLVCMGVRKAFEIAGEAVPPLKYVCRNRIPYARGLGSSSAAIVAGLIAGLVLTGHRLRCWGSESLLQLAAAIEGHPDNVAPAIYGGIQLGIHNGQRWQSERVSIPSGLQIVVFIPNTIGKTADARAVLEDTVTREDAVFNVGRTAWLVNAFNQSRLENLHYGTQDRLHQPQRGKSVYPHLYPLIDAATASGADACFLSGAGPAVMALTSGASGDIFAQRAKERTDTVVAAAMIKAANLVGVEGQVFITQPIETGAYVVSTQPSFSSKTMVYRGDV